MSNAVNKLILERLDAIEVDLEKKYLEYEHTARHSRENDVAFVAIRLLEGERRELEDHLVAMKNSAKAARALVALVAKEHSNG